MTTRPAPPQPGLLRRPPKSFGWIDARMLQQGWFSHLGAEAIAVFALLAIAADQAGASFYGHDKMGRSLSMDRNDVQRALDRLLELRLVDVRPWSPGQFDGVWQILPLPREINGIR